MGNLASEGQLSYNIFVLSFGVDSPSVRFYREFFFVLYVPVSLSLDMNGANVLQARECMYKVKMSFGWIFASWFVQCMLILCMFCLFCIHSVSLCDILHL